jgi:hypothetical protein
LSLGMLERSVRRHLCRARENGCSRQSQVWNSLFVHYATRGKKVELGKRDVGTAGIQLEAGNLSIQERCESAFICQNRFISRLERDRALKLVFWARVDTKHSERCRRSVAFGDVRLIWRCECDKGKRSLEIHIHPHAGPRLAWRQLSAGTESRHMQAKWLVSVGEIAFSPPPIKRFLIHDRIFLSRSSETESEIRSEWPSQSAAHWKLHFTIKRKSIRMQRENRIKRERNAAQ